MRSIKLINGALWGVNGLLGLGIVAFAFQFLLFPEKVNYAADIPEYQPSTSRAGSPSGPKDDLSLKGLANPIIKAEVAVNDTRSVASLFKAVLKGTMPSYDDPKQGIAFIRSAGRNTELVAYMGETITYEGKPYDEFMGWVLTEVYKDKAVFSNGSRKETLVLDQGAAIAGPSLPGPPGPGGPGKVNRLGQPYASESFKSKLLASSDNRQVWGIDLEELDWIRQNQDQVIDNDFQVSMGAGGGVKIETMAAGSVGASRGLMTGDLVREVNGVPLNSVADLKTMMGEPSMQKTAGVRITLERAGKPMVLEYRPLSR